MAVKTDAGVAETSAVIILNPSAGGGRGRRASSLLEAEASDWERRPPLLTTTGRGDATALARRCAEDGVRLVIAAGGDGTAHEVVQGLLEVADGGEGPTLGYLPLGTGCDLALALGLPRQPGGLLGRLRRGTDVRVDVGVLEADDDRRQLRRWFLNAANIGLGPAVAARVSASERLRRWGTPAYLMAAARALLRTTPQLLRWETDEGEGGEGPVVNLSVCNGPSFGGGMRPCPDAGLDSGRLHVAVVRPLNLLAALGQIPRLMHGRLDHPAIRNFSCREIRISGRQERIGQREVEPIPVEVDGEISGPLPVRLHVRPRGLKVRLPRDVARSFTGSD